MARYRVKQLWLSGKGNLIFKSGAIVTDEQFPPGNAAELVKRGAIVPVEDQRQASVPAAETSSKTVAALKVELGITDAPKENKPMPPFQPSKTIEDWTVKELRKELNITDPMINKQGLYDLWVESEKKKYQG